MTHENQITLIDTAENPKRAGHAPRKNMPFISGLQTTDRLKGIGGSDIAPIVGKIPSFHKRDATTVYLEKIGSRPQFQGNKATRWGTIHEESLIKEYLTNHPDITMFTMPRGQTIRHAEYPFIFATPDGICFDKEGNAYIFEAKTSRYPSNKEGARWGEEGTQTIPDNVHCQIAWYNMVLSSWGTQLGDSEVYVLIGGSDDCLYSIDRDENFEQALLQSGIEFWEKNVLGKVAPDPSHTEAYALILKDRYPKPTNQVLAPASGDLEKIAREYYDTKKTITDKQDRLKWLENRMRDYIGNNEGVVGPELESKPGKHLFQLTWKLERKSSTNRSNILRELGVTSDSEIFKRHTKRTHTRVLRKTWRYEEE
jgi:predicted phage-related endonuclease